MTKVLTITKKYIIWVFIIIYLIISFGFIHKQESKILCNNLSITVVDSAYNAFVRPQDVLSILQHNNIELLHHKLDSINLNKLEKTVLKNQSIKKVTAYKTIKGDVKILISQRKPIVRILNYNGESYYIDERGNLMQLSNNYTSRIIIALGAINEPYDILKDINFSKKDSSLDEITKKTKLFDIYTLAKYINNNKFLRALIDQIYINNDGDFELITKINPSVIKFGDADNYDKKFKKLIIFYKKELPKVGWNKYKTINLMYKNQIVCEKR